MLMCYGGRGINEIMAYLLQSVKEAGKGYPQRGPGLNLENL